MDVGPGGGGKVETAGVSGRGARRLDNESHGLSGGSLMLNRSAAQSWRVV